MKSLANVRTVLSLAATVLIFTAVLGVVALQSSPNATADKTDAGKSDGRHEWRLYGGSLSRNLVNLVEKNMPETWDVAGGKNILWSVELGDKAYGGPIVAGGHIYIGTNNGNPRDKSVKGDKGVLMCFRESDGKFLWQAIHDKLESGRVNDWPREGICSSPIVEGNRLYYVNNRAEVICADVEGMANGNQGEQDETYKGANDADVIWRLDMMDEFGVFPHNLAVCSPLIAGDLLFAVTANGVDENHIRIPAPAAPSFLAINKKTGKFKWKDNAPSKALVNIKQGTKSKLQTLVNQGQVLMHGQWSNPVYAEPNGKPMIIFPGGDGWIRAYHPEKGDLLWKFDCNPKKTTYKLGSKNSNRSDFVSTPVVWENKLYIGVGQDPEHKSGVGHLWCIDITKEPKNKEKDLTPVNNNFDPKAEVNKDSGLVWHFGGKAPEESERPYLFGRSLSTCAVHDGLCYAADFDGYIYCLDANTGAKYWDDNLGANTWSSPSWIDGKIYIGTENGRVCIYEHGKTKKPVKKIDMKAEYVRVTPVAANGVLYVMTEDPTKLWAISNKK